MLQSDTVKHVALELQVRGSSRDAVILKAEAGKHPGNILFIVTESNDPSLILRASVIQAARHPHKPLQDRRLLIISHKLSQTTAVSCVVIISKEIF